MEDETLDDDYSGVEELINHNIMLFNDTGDKDAEDFLYHVMITQDYFAYKIDGKYELFLPLEVYTTERSYN